MSSNSNNSQGFFRSGNSLSEAHVNVVEEVGVLERQATQMSTVRPSETMSEARQVLAEAKNKISEIINGHEVTESNTLSSPPSL